MKPENPILYCDVDGVLNALGGQITGLDYDSWGDFEMTEGAGFPLFLSQKMAKAIIELPVEHRWATIWRNEANVTISPMLGWPQLPVLTEPNPIAARKGGYNFKHFGVLDEISEEQRPFIWMDDEAIPYDHSALDELGVNYLLIEPDAMTGVTPADIESIKYWLATGEQPYLPNRDADSKDS